MLSSWSPQSSLAACSEGVRKCLACGNLNAQSDVLSDAVLRNAPNSSADIALSSPPLLRHLLTSAGFSVKAVFNAAARVSTMALGVPAGARIEMNAVGV